MAKKKKPVKKPAIKKNTKARRRPVKKPAAKKKAAKKKVAAQPAGGLRLTVSSALESRLAALAKSMSKGLDEVLIQALTEFADNWEDHMRTVSALNEGDDRMQLVVPQE